MTKELEKTFQTIFSATPDGTFFSPGRINLIGEHTDYNGGNVFPAAITLGTDGLIRKRNDQVFRFYSTNFPEIGVIEVDMDHLAFHSDDLWANYPKGVIYLLKEAGYEINEGCDILFNGTIPNGAGLSSSASIELLTGLMMKDEFDLNIDQLDLVKLGQQVENNYIGVNTGIMDQFAIGMGEADHALLLNTNTLDYEVVPAEFGNYTIVIMNTNKRRELADSKYNERRRECDEALKDLQQELTIDTLCDIDLATFKTHEHLITNEVNRKRAKHAISENERTLKAKDALTNKDLKEFGQLLNASHLSLKEDYDVTGVELDTLVALAQSSPDTLGARMTGAGFGGCAIALVDKDKLDDFITFVGDGYKEKIGYPADFYVADIGDGTKKIK